MKELVPMRRVLRRKAISLLVRLLETEELRAWRNHTAAKAGTISRDIRNPPNPYSSVIGLGERPDFSGTIFITGRFRSGSTLLWNLFRKLDGYTSYYEPFNERRWFDSDVRGGHIDISHHGVENYWSEYAGLNYLTQHYREDWTRYNLYMEKDQYEPAMQAYIDKLISAAKGNAVLQFNRVDFRLPWLRENYPGATIIHIYRNPRDQWCSVLKGSPYPKDAQTGGGFKDHFYHQIWVRDLCLKFPFLADFNHHHQYFTFYLLWKLSFDFGLQYADFSISMERLIEAPRASLADILAVTKTETDLDSLDVEFVKNTVSRWQSYAPDQWFHEIEVECERVLDGFLKIPGNS